jgi:predicted transcriptional regulator
MPTTWTRTILGPLELQTMNLVWKLNECCVRDVVVRMPQQRAYTTIMTTLDRLYQKGVLNRKKTNGKFVYCARLTRQQLEEAVDRDLVSKVLTRPRASREMIISALLESMLVGDPQMFNRIVRAARARRRVQNNGGGKPRLAAAALHAS